MSPKKDCLAIERVREELPIDALLDPSNVTLISPGNRIGLGNTSSFVKVNGLSEGAEKYNRNKSGMVEFQLFSSQF